VGGTMCAASPAKYSRPEFMGCTTKLRMAVTFLLRIEPTLGFHPSQEVIRFGISYQMASSDHLRMSWSGGTWK